MDNVAGLSNKERAELFSESAAQMGVSPAIIEKDFWVCWVLQKMFQSRDLENKLLFKGGTSLSKVYKAIERFSEDIDLILNWDLVSEGTDPRDERSGTQQDKLNKKMNRTAQGYIKQELKPLLVDLCSPHCTVSVDQQDPHCLNLSYPQAFEDQYIRPVVLLEIGPLASWLPHGTFTIRPYAAEYFPSIFQEPDVTVQAIEGRRTFWEKATILHQEANRPADKNQPSRLSRHYYDLAMLTRSEIKDQAIADIRMLGQVTAFKSKFYPQIWANYESAAPGTLKLIPPEERIKELARDYAAMKDMIFGEYLSLDEIFRILGELELEINGNRE